MRGFRKVFSVFLIIFLVLFGYITLVVILKKANKLIQEAYPEYKIVKNL